MDEDVEMATEAAGDVDEDGESHTPVPTALQSRKRVLM